MEVDREIGELLKLVDQNTDVLVVSDHGAKRMDGGICVNEWLMEKGYLAIHDKPDSAVPLSKVKIDWPKTKAWGDGGYYARIFLNVAGREPQGTIPPEDYEKVRDELIAGLKSIKDENGGEIGKFGRERRTMCLPDPLTLVVDRAPAYFVGQSFGGVYPAGAYSPEAKTILFLPVPPPGATAEERDAFFRDFNRPFSRMIVPHELIPGHYVQLKYAARDPHKVRALFPDPVYVEGWGTFCERLLLDQGWGDALPRLAHLKKQLENIARTIVDIRVHTENMSREEMTRFVKDEALQGEQLANNMWTRTLTSSQQITTYYLGYRKVTEVYKAARAAQGDKFELRRLMDGMMRLGPVPLEHYLELEKSGVTRN